jgi:drug/metabolite transporter (DMT)-like permease
VQDQRIAILLILASIGFITVVDTSAKYLTAELHAFEIVWGYFLGIFLLLGIYAVAIGARRRGLLRTGRPVLQVARSGLLVLSIATLFVGLTYLPIAEATAIGFMSPLFIVALSVPVLGERVGIHRWVAVVIGLLGVLVIVRPGGGLAHWAVFMPLIGAVCFAAYQLSTRVLAATDTVFATLFYTGAGGFFWTCLLVPFVWTVPTLAEWIGFIAIGSLGVVAHLCLIKAFEVAQASLLAPFNYTKMIWAALAGYLVFGDIPSLNTLAGCALITASGLYVILRERPAPKVTQ